MMPETEKCPLDGSPCEYTDQQVLSFLESKDTGLDACLHVFCPAFRHRLIRLVKEGQQKKPVADLGLFRRMGELEGAFDDFTASGMSD